MEGLTLEELYLLRDKVDAAIRELTRETEAVSQRACSNMKCPCRFYYPGGRTRADLQAVPVIADKKLVISFLCEHGETYQEERTKLSKVISPIRAEHVTVLEDKHVGFLVFLTHLEATRAQQRLECAGYVVNFMCENIKEIKGATA